MTISTAGMVFAVVIFIATLAASIEVKPGNLSYAQVVPAPNPMCKPGDAHINGTESRECGIPKTISSPSPANTTTTPAGTITSMTTGAPKPLSPSSSPSSTQPLAENTTTPQGAIPGIFHNTPLHQLIFEENNEIEYGPKIYNIDYILC